MPASELDGFLDRLTARAAELGLPFNVSLDGVDETSLDIVVGVAVASVQRVRDDPWCCQVSVAGGFDASEDLVWFAGNGQYSQLPRRWWIDVPLAREAVRHYFNTAQLTPLVRWEEL